MKTGKIIRRILGLPFFMCMALIGVVYLWLKYIKNYILYGGEAIVYTHKNEPKMIKDIYEKIQERL